MEGFKKLKVVEKAHFLTLEIYKITLQYPKNEQYGIVFQLRRAAVSIPSNLAEGYTRQSSKEFRQGINIAKGSHAELEYLLFLSKDLGYISSQTYKELESKLAEVGKMLTGLYKAVDQKVGT